MVAVLTDCHCINGCEHFVLQHHDQIEVSGSPRGAAAVGGRAPDWTDELSLGSPHVHIQDTNETVPSAACLQVSVPLS